MTMSSKFANIFEYIDYRKFLKNYQETRRNTEKRFTRAQFTKAIGLPNTRSFMNDVISGRKNLTESFIERIIRVIEFSEEESRFFRVLVKYNQASVENKELYFDQLISLNQTPKRVLDQNAYAYYKEWFNPVIRSLLGIVDFDGTDYAVLTKKIHPSISIRQAKKSVALMLKLKLIKPDKNGCLRPCEKVLTTGPAMQNALVMANQKKVLDIAKDAIFTETPMPKRVITKWVTVSDKAYETINRKLTTYSAELNSIIHKDEEPADRLYQVNLMCIPFSK